MRFTVRKKIVLAFAMILLCGILSMLLIYHGLSVLRKAMHELADVKEPLSAAAYEMEINVNGIALGILKYLDHADPAYRELVEDDEQDFAQFHTRYLRLAQTWEERELGRKIGLRYSEFKLLGQQLMTIRDAQEPLLQTLGEHFAKIDAIIDNNLPAKLDLQGHDGAPKLALMQALESDITEIGFWLLQYQRSQTVEHKQLLLRNEQEFRDVLAQFNTFPLSEAERRWTGTLAEAFHTMMALAHQVLALEEQLRQGTRQFVHTRLEIDALVDDELQPLAVTALFAPRREADQETARVIRTILFVIPLFVLAVISVAWLLIRAITRPVQALVRGTQAVRRGNLDYRVDSLSQDEFGELADYFNQMVAELQTTTVSKVLLQDSEARLQETVDALRREISARTRSEEERALLQASLRHSEIMAAMGSLVARVAHDVRNPLFAISSTLDAFAARFVARQEYQRYLSVLRAEVLRLTTLMQALLEYGKPVQLALIPDAPEEAFVQALHFCLPLATRLNVRICAPSRQYGSLARMDRQRLVQMFQNLLENAIQYSPAVGCVVVESEEVYLDGQGWISWTIKDAGPGFCPADLPRIFAPFFTRRRGGTGLGLAIVQHIIDEHGGSIVAGNRPEGGAVMVVRLPLIQQRLLAGRDQERHSGTEQDLSGR